MSERMPTSVVLSFVGVWFQVIAGVFGAFVMLSLLSGRLDHGQEVQNAGLVRGLVLFSLVVTAVLAVSGFLASKRYRWTRIVILAAEAVAVLDSLIGLVSGGGIPMLVKLVLALTIGAVLLTDKGLDWFDR
ncbi:hypothetical protein E1292_12425 [Nonomuraea deserti]|uniref:Uncharacterized protein n=1 Tax=Nonomuraea deserti TaxID=1848322 RepID=A0A4R4VQ96_9ACTN|nr:hypothetical protein [Nonomuraea deserti]TDD07952.1 hypothetical protein E1292_12425 [Nonomuraea deserti]